MGEALVAFGGGALKGVGIAQQQAAERALQKATLDLQQKKFKLEEEESQLKIKQLQRSLSQDPMALLREAARLMGGDPNALGGGSAPQTGSAPQPDLSAPQPGMEGGFAVRAPTIPQAPTGQPGAPASGAGMRIQPSFSIDEKGGVRVTLSGQQKQLKIGHHTIVGEGGVPVIVERLLDPDTGAVLEQRPVGVAPSGREKERMEAEAASLGFKPGTEAFNYAVGRMGILQKLPPEERIVEFQNLQNLGQQQQSQAPTGKATLTPPSFEQTRKEAGKLKQERVRIETEAREEAQRLAGGFSEEDRKALQVQSQILAIIEFQESQFSDEEIATFVGVLNRPIEQAKLAIRGIMGDTGVNRFAEFKVMNERLRGTAFTEGGKQLTPFEASVVFGYTMTGREAGGAPEYLAKRRNLKTFLTISREVRIELAKKGRGEFNIAELDARIKQRMQEVGLPFPGQGIQGAGTPATAVPSGRGPQAKPGQPIPLDEFMRQQGATR